MSRLNDWKRPGQGLVEYGVIVLLVALIAVALYVSEITAWLSWVFDQAQRMLG